MKATLQIYMSVNGVKKVTEQSVGKEPSCLDRVSFYDDHGNAVQADVGLLYNTLLSLSRSKDMKLSEYLDKIQASTAIDAEVK